MGLPKELQVLGHDVYAMNFDESQHPRADDGKFGSGGGNVGSPKPDGKGAGPANVGSPKPDGKGAGPAHRGSPLGGAPSVPLPAPSPEPANPFGFEPGLSDVDGEVSRESGGLDGITSALNGGGSDSPTWSEDDDFAGPETGWPNPEVLGPGAFGDIDPLPPSQPGAGGPEDRAQEAAALQSADAAIENADWFSEEPAKPQGIFGQVTSALNKMLTGGV